MPIDHDLLYSSLGTFFGLFPPEDRARVTSIWDAIADKSADLAGRAVQIKDSESVFRTRAFVERVMWRAKLGQLTEDPITEFELVSVTQQTSELFIFKGYLPAAKSISREVIPEEGKLIIGADVLDYIESNIEVLNSGPREGLVAEATFTVREPPRDYADTVDPNESFPQVATQLTLRRNHIAGETAIDATGPVGLTFNERGRIVLDGSEYEYKSVTATLGVYFFQLASTYSAPDAAVQSLPFNYDLGEEITVYSYDDDRWSDESVGAVRVTASPLKLFVDELPSVASSKASIASKFELEIGDFDVNMTLSVDKWVDPTVNVTSRTAGMGLRIGGNRYIVGPRVERDGAAAITHHIAFGAEASPQLLDLEDAAAGVQVRALRSGSRIEFQYRVASGDPWIELGFETTTSERATISFNLIDTGTGTGSEVEYDELERFLGEVAGGSRLEATFEATSRFPYRYVLDSQMVDAEELIDRPFVREEPLTVQSEETDTELRSLVCAFTDETEGGGVPLSGVLVIGGYERVYENATIGNNVSTLELRRKLPPDLFPIAAGTSVTVKTNRAEKASSGFEFEEPGVIRMRELPTRGEMWAPVAKVDEQLLQKMWAPLTKSGGNRESSLALERLIQGHFAALMGGPTIFNIRSGLALSMGLPVAERSGVVSEMSESTDDLGRTVQRKIVVTDENGSLEYILPDETSMLINWTVEVGAQVKRFQPLTNGVEVLDLDNEPSWPDRFADVQDAERFRSFGVILDVSALGPDSDIAEALRFALRIKPNDTKIFIGLFTESLGVEDLSDDLDDEARIASLVLPCEDMGFDEGPLAPGVPVTLGAGRRLGQGFILGTENLQKYLSLGTGLFLGQGLTLGQSVIYACEPVQTNQPSVDTSFESIIGIMISP